MNRNEQETKPEAIHNKKLFSLEYSISTKIKTEPAKIWSLLTNAPGFPRWNSTVERIEGKIAAGEKIRVFVKISPGRAFPLRVSEFLPNKKMIWQDGNPIFKGVRTYTLTAQEGGITEFSMSEVFSGLMLPLIAPSLPDFVPAFEQYAADLKAEAEKKE